MRLPAYKGEEIPVSEPNEEAVEEPEFSQERVEEMADLNARAVLVNEDGSAL